MIKMTISKALRYKKRVVAKIQKLESDIISNNSVIEPAVREVNVPDLLRERNKLVQHLTDVKLKIATVSVPIQRMILECAEAKSYIAFLNKMPVLHGLKSDYGEALTYNAQFRKTDRDKAITFLESRIDHFQTSIDAFNNTNHIEVEDMVSESIEELSLKGYGLGLISESNRLVLDIVDRMENDDIVDEQGNKVD